MKKNQKKLAALVALLLVFVLGGTFAYFNQTMTVENPFDTGKYDSVVTEDFNPEDGENWEPGATVDKKVAVDNTGDYPIVARVKFEDTWVNKESKQTIFASALGRDGSTAQDDPADGLVAGDRSVVQLLFNGTDGVPAGWTYNPEDGYWYYDSVLDAKATTGAFLTAVKLIENADMGTYDVKKYYTKASTAPEKTEIGTDPTKEWVEYTEALPEGSLHNMTTTVQTTQGYSNANYTLKITVQTVQATKAAAEAAFGTDNVLTDWALE